MKARVELKKSVNIIPVEGQDGRYKVGRKMFWLNGKNVRRDNGGNVVAIVVSTIQKINEGEKWDWPIPVENFDLENSPKWAAANAEIEGRNAHRAAAATKHQESQDAKKAKEAAFLSQLWNAATLTGELNRRLGRTAFRVWKGDKIWITDNDYGWLERYADGAMYVDMSRDLTKLEDQLLFWNIKIANKTYGDAHGRLAMVHCLLSEACE